MTTHSLDRLAHMANQIARNLTFEGYPAQAVAEHIRAFWAPPMIADLIATGGIGLDAVALEAMELLKPA